MKTKSLLVKVRNTIALEKVKVMEDQLHRQRVKEKGQQFEDIEDDDEDNHIKTNKDKQRENQKKGEMIYQ